MWQKRRKGFTTVEITIVVLLAGYILFYPHPAKFKDTNHDGLQKYMEEKADCIQLAALVNKTIPHNDPKYVRMNADYIVASNSGHAWVSSARLYIESSNEVNVDSESYTNSDAHKKIAHCMKALTASLSQDGPEKAMFMSMSKSLDLGGSAEVLPGLTNININDIEKFFGYLRNINGEDPDKAKKAMDRIFYPALADWPTFESAKEDWAKTVSGSVESAAGRK